MCRISDIADIQTKKMCVRIRISLADFERTVSLTKFSIFKLLNSKLFYFMYIIIYIQWVTSISQRVGRDSRSTSFSSFIFNNRCMHNRFLMLFTWAFFKISPKWSTDVQCLILFTTVSRGTTTTARNADGKASLKSKRHCKQCIIVDNLSTVNNFAR